MATFTTTFDHGDTIYFMSDSKVASGTIRRIEIDSVQIIEVVDDVDVATLTTVVLYYCDDIANPVTEGNAFATKQALLDSL